MANKPEYDSIDDKYIIKERISEGHFGEVFLVIEKKEKRKYAAKILFKDDNHFDQKIELIKKITNLNNPYIINYIESSKEGKIKIKNLDNVFITKQYAIYEYASKKTICEYLLFPNSNKLEEKYAKILFKYILKGIQAMHEAGICHRDIKLGNILLDDSFKPRICDFGLSFECKDKKLKGRCGTPEYCAPEIMLKKGYQPYDGKKADIFSLGITLLYMTIGTQQDDAVSEFVRYKKENNYNDYINLTKIQIQNISQDLQNLIIQMLDFNPDKRPSIENILDCPWMIDIKKDDLNQEKDLSKEFKRREDIIEANKITTIQTNEEEKDTKNFINNKNKSLRKCNENAISFEQKFIIKNIKENNIELRDYLNIYGKINPFKFMNFIINKLNEEIKGGHVEANQNYYIIEVKYEYSNEDDEDENEELIEKEEEEFIDDKYGISQKDLFIQIILFESENGNHILQFYKKTGEIEDYYKKLEKIISIIKNSITLY